MDGLINVVPKLMAKIDYEEIEEYNPIEYLFMNRSEGRIDSLKWFIDGSLVSDQNDFKNIFLYNGVYNIKLLIFSHIFRDSVSIDLNIKNNYKEIAQIDSSIIFEESFKDISFSFYEGYETDRGEFIYRNDRGRINIFSKDNEFLSIYKYDVYNMSAKLMKNDRGELFCIEYHNNLFNSTYSLNLLKLTRDTVILLTKIPPISGKLVSDVEIIKDELMIFSSLNNGFIPTIDLLVDDTLQIVKSFDKYSMGFGDGTSIDKYISHFTKCENEYQCFYLMKYTKTYENGYNIYHITDNVFYTTLQCPKDYPMTEMVSKDSLIFSCGENGIVYAFNNEGDSLWSVSLNGKLNHCLMAGDTLILSGSIQDQCGYYVLDLDGNLLDSLFIQGRIGEFNHCSECPDGAFLFSGSRSDTLGSHYCYSSKINIFGRKVKITPIDTTDIPIDTVNTSIIAFHQISGNPSIGGSTVEFDLQEDSKIQIDIFDINGNLVKQIANSSFKAGRNKLNFSTEDMIGIFFYRITAGRNVKFGKFMVMN